MLLSNILVEHVLEKQPNKINLNFICEKFFFYFVRKSILVIKQYIFWNFEDIFRATFQLFTTNETHLVSILQPNFFSSWQIFVNDSKNFCTKLKITCSETRDNLHVLQNILSDLYSNKVKLEFCTFWRNWMKNEEIVLKTLLDGILYSIFSKSIIF